MKYLKFIVLVLSISLIASCGPDDEGITFEEQLEKDIQTIDAYLAENNIDAEIHSSGIRYIIHNEGEGNNPSDYDDITVTYEGRYLSNNSVFDSNAEGITFQLFNLINAWRSGLPLIKEGGSMTIYAPSGLCYGEFGLPQAGIPTNANMIFDLELIEIIE